MLIMIFNDLPAVRLTRKVFPHLLPDLIVNVHTRLGGKHLAPEHEVERQQHLVFL
jgi:hypothetical protein